MATSVTMPALGESVTEGTVTTWLKQVGDTVELDEPIVEVSTDKVDSEVPSPVAGVLLVAVGRGPVTEGLGYEQVGITLDRGFVITNERLHTGVGNIYAVGDIVPGLQLAHRGFMQGVFVAEEIAGLNPTMQADINIPRVTFCEPEIASVGMTEKQAREKFGDQVRTVEYNLAGNGKSSILATSGIIKLVSVEGGPIVGFHGIGARIGEQIGEGELMVNWEAYPSDVASLIHAHPSQNESLGEAAMALAGKPLHVHN